MKYLIIQTRSDAIGKINDKLVDGLKDFKVIEFKWKDRPMLINHFFELISSILFSLKLKKDDIVLSTNSKSVHTHIIPLFSRCKKYMIHYHFDEKPLLVHKVPGWSYQYLFKHWFTIFAAKYTENVAKETMECINSCTIYPGFSLEEAI